MFQKSGYMVVIFILGIAVGVVGWNILTLATPSPAYAETSVSANGIIAVTGLCTNQSAGLWVLDTRETKFTPSLCLYIPDVNGRTLKLSAARRIKWDLQLLQYNDSTDRRYSPSALRDEIEKLNEEQEKKKK